MQPCYTLGAGVEATHIRGGKELGYLIKDHNYDFNFQYLRKAKEPIKVMPVSTNITK